ncbi:MAG TPA: hypothetical protein VL949_09025, partial [Geobacteraceae bacterium]|nr:hypothetical protein [Geobacteraceae bacterium]
MFGVKADYCLVSGDAGNLSLEGFVNAAYMSSKIDNSSSFAYMLRVGPLFSFHPIGNLTPLLSAGVGGMYLPSPVASSPDKAAFLTFGIGASYAVSKDMAIRADISRQVVIDINGSNSFELTLGWSFEFDGREKKAPLADISPSPTEPTASLPPQPPAQAAAAVAATTPAAQPAPTPAPGAAATAPPAEAKVETTSPTGATPAAMPAPAGGAPTPEIIKPAEAASSAPSGGVPARVETAAPPAEVIPPVPAPATAVEAKPAPAPAQQGTASGTA